jgi:hypothetical protein
VIRALEVIAVILVAAGMALPTEAPAQTPAQGQAVGILFLLGASRSGAHATAKTAEQKPKPAIATSEKVRDRLVDVKQKPLSVKDRTVLARMGAATTVPIPDKVARPASPLPGTKRQPQARPTG